MPYAVIGTISYERQLPWGLFAVGQYTHTKGEHLLRLRNINAPQSGVAAGRRPRRRQPCDVHVADPAVRIDRTIAAAPDDGRPARAHQEGADVLRQLHVRQEGERYRHGRTRRRPIRTISRWTTAPRRTISGTRSWRAPRWNSRRVVHHAVGVGRVGPAVQHHDRRGQQRRHALLRPPGLRGAWRRGRDSSRRYGLLDPNPSLGDAIIPRNFGREPWQTSVNLNISQTFPGNIILGVDADNLLNNKRLVRSNGVLISPTFGMPNLALNGRRLLFSLRYGF